MHSRNTIRYAPKCPECQHWWETLRRKIEDFIDASSALLIMNDLESWLRLNDEDDPSEDRPQGDLPQTTPGPKRLRPEVLQMMVRTT